MLWEDEELSAIGDQARAAIAEMEAELTATQEELAITQAELDACKNPSPFELLFEEDWSAGIDPARWFVQPAGSQFNKDHATVVEGKLRLTVFRDLDDVWRGGLVGMREALSFTYGKVEVECYLESGWFRAVADLWTEQIPWPENGETDFFEIGADDPERITNTQSFHHGPFTEPPPSKKHAIEHTGYDGVAPPFTALHTIGVEWTRGLLVYTCDGFERARVESPEVPSWPMKLHLQSARPDKAKPLEGAPGAFVIEKVRVYSWDGE